MLNRRLWPRFGELSTSVLLPRPDQGNARHPAPNHRLETHAGRGSAVRSQFQHSSRVKHSSSSSRAVPGSGLSMDLFARPPFPIHPTTKKATLRETEVRTVVWDQVVTGSNETQPWS